MREVFKKTILQCIIEGMIGRTVEGGMSKCYKVGVKVMAHYGRSMIGGRCRAIKSPYPGVDILGAIVSDISGSISDCCTMFIKHHRAIQVVCKCCDALERMVKIGIVENMNRKCISANRRFGSGYGRNRCTIWKDDICRRVWGGKEKGRGEDIRITVKIITGSAIKPRERRGVR